MVLSPAPLCLHLAPASLCCWNCFRMWGEGGWSARQRDGAAGASLLAAFPGERILSASGDAAKRQPWLLNAAEEGEHC